MAEIFGVVASTVALFHNCVETFNYIQVGRRFGQEYEQCQLKLGIARLRLTRWGEAVSIDGDRPFSSADTEPDEEFVKTAKVVLEQLQLLFEEAEGISRRYKGASDQEGSSHDGAGTVSVLGQRLQERLKDIAKKRHKRTGLVRKTSWALHDSQRTHGIIQDINGFIDSLENLLASQGRRQELLALARLEAEEMNEEPMLAALQDAATEVDSILVEAVEHRCKEIAQNNSADSIETDEAARVRLGNEWTQGAMELSAGFEYPNKNSTKVLVAKGASRIHIGNSFGGRGIMDD